jgi:hypothetical protein
LSIVTGKLVSPIAFVSWCTASLSPFIEREEGVSVEEMEEGLGEAGGGVMCGMWPRDGLVRIIGEDERGGGK